MQVSFFKKVFLSLPLKVRVSIYFFYRHRYLLSISKPTTFSEKVNCRKFNYLPVYSILADKYEVRTYVAEKIGEQYLIPLVYSCDSKDFKSFPILDGNLVAKTNHGSGPKHIEFLPSGKTNVELFQKFDAALSSEFDGVLFGEGHYSSIPKKIIVEKRLGEGSVPEDFKFHIFENNDDPIWFLQVDAGRFVDHIRNFYDSNMELINLQLLHPNGEYNLPSSDSIRDMASLGVKLCAGLKYARVDFYLVDSKIYFGEITLTPGSGFEKFSDLSMDEQWGKFWC
ncbi:ATP-grasp fold amidoligase family protein [Shewanella sp. AC91-MNA-CIBAN-0169]|uniref:ATP-grasp fold amidoligase family protein n=1 Tax=Shewanella sp. AC91-MNA-CIBAN-0169 TaxID=3140466 RepID=UPI00331C4B1E